MKIRGSENQSENQSVWYLNKSKAVKQVRKQLQQVIDERLVSEYYLATALSLMIKKYSFQLFEVN
jgi:hypothetical protein